MGARRAVFVLTAVSCAILLAGRGVWAVELEQHPIDDLIEGDRKAPELAGQEGGEAEQAEAPPEPEKKEKEKPKQWYEKPVETRPALPTYPLGPADQFFSKAAIGPEEKTGRVRLKAGEREGGVELGTAPAEKEDEFLEEDLLDPDWWAESFDDMADPGAVEGEADGADDQALQAPADMEDAES